jgi:hypothetical protein
MPELTSQTVEATYEGDILRLHDSLPLSKQQRVWVVVIPIPESTLLTRETPSPDELLCLAAQVYEGLSPDDIDEIERVVLDRSHFFTRQE